MRAPWDWWLDRRPLGRIVDGKWVEAPQRLERAGAWLWGRPKPSQPPRRIVSLAFLVWLSGTVLASWVLPQPLWRDYLGALQWVLIAVIIVMTVVGLGVLAVIPRRRK